MQNIQATTELVEPRKNCRKISLNARIHRNKNKINSLLTKSKLEIIPQDLTGQYFTMNSNKMRSKKKYSHVSCESIIDSGSKK